MGCGLWALAFKASDEKVMEFRFVMARQYTDTVGSWRAYLDTQKVGRTFLLR
jgi:lactam utilization protein B